MVQIPTLATTRTAKMNIASEAHMHHSLMALWLGKLEAKKAAAGRVHVVQLVNKRT
jgi:hypothetical protein